MNIIKTSLVLLVTVLLSLSGYAQSYQDRYAAYMLSYQKSQIESAASSVVYAESAFVQGYITRDSQGSVNGTFLSLAQSASDKTRASKDKGEYTSNTYIRIYMRDSQYNMYVPVLILWDPRGGPDTNYTCDTWTGLTQIYLWYFKNVLNGPNPERRKAQ